MSYFLRYKIIVTQLYTIGQKPDSLACYSLIYTNRFTKFYEAMKGITDKALPKL